MKHICIYCNWNPTAGGVKTASLELGNALKQKGYKITIAFLDSAVRNHAFSNISLLQYGQVGDVVRITPETPDIECDACVIASNHTVADQIKAKKYIGWIHSNYKLYNNLQLAYNPKVTEYVAVSQSVAEVAKEMFGIKPVVIHNLLRPNFAEETENRLKLVSATRIGAEKGFDRKRRFAEILEENKIPYTWDIYGESTDKTYEEQVKATFSHLPNVRFRGFILDVRQVVKEADYLVQLSDFEGFCYSILESLVLGTPIIVTNYGGVEEMVKDEVNGYIVPLEIDTITKKRLKQIQTKIPKFTYKQTGCIEKWEKLFN